MSTPVITIFVRHTPGCKWAPDEFTKQCRCRKHLRWTLGGRQFRKQAGTRSWDEAGEVRRRLEDQLAGNATDAPVDKPKDKTIRDAFDMFMEDKKVIGLESVTLQKYRLEVGRFVAYCEGLNVYTFAGLTFAVIMGFRGTWANAYESSYTRHFVQKRFRGFLKFCLQAGLIPHVPKMAPIKITEPPTLPLSGKEYEKLLDAVALEFTNGTAAKVRGIIMLMRYSGLAVRDASLIKWQDVIFDVEKDLYRVKATRQKTGMPVTVPIPKFVAEELRAICAGNRGFVFYDPAATLKEITFGQMMSTYIGRVFTRAKIHTKGHMKSHRLRDTFAVDLLSKGVPMEEVSKLLGHDSIKTTEKHYAQWAKGRQDRVDELVTGTWAIGA